MYVRQPKLSQNKDLAPVEDKIGALVLDMYYFAKSRFNVIIAINVTGFI